MRREKKTKNKTKGGEEGESGGRSDRTRRRDGDGDKRREKEIVELRDRISTRRMVTKAQFTCEIAHALCRFCLRLYCQHWAHVGKIGKQIASLALLYSTGGSFHTAW